MSAERFNRFLADALTIFRFFAAGIVWAGLHTTHPSGEVFALGAFVLGAISDFLDGRLARRAGGYTSYGKVLDPLADKALTLTAFAGLASRGVLGWWFVWLVAARDILVTCARFWISPKHSAARSSGKWKTALQMIFIIVGLLVLVIRMEPSESKALQLFLTWGSVLIAGLTLWSGIRFLAAPFFGRLGKS